MTVQILTWLAVAMAAAGAAWDIHSRRLPNLLCIALAVICMALTVVSLGTAGLVSTGLHAFAALIAGMLLFRAGMIGGGDAKFYGAAALAVPLAAALPMLGWTSLAGLVVLVSMVSFRALTGGGKATKKDSWTVPYGVPIAAGFVAVILPPALT